MRLLFGVFICLALQACSLSRAPAYIDQSSQRITDGYAQLEFAAAQFSNRAVTCEADPKISLQHLEKHWKATMLKWQRIQWVGFGPILQPARRWQIQFWPDTKNTIGRKMNVLLRQGSVSEIDLQRAGAIAHSLSALEYVLFDPSREEFDLKKRCRLADLIGQSLVNTTSDLNSEWQLYRDISFIASMESDSLEKTDAVLSDLVLSLVAQLDHIINQKIAGPFGLPKLKDRAAAPGQTNLYFLESWRSGLSFDSLRVSYLSIQHMLIDGGLLQQLNNRGQTELSNGIQEKMRHIESLLIQETQYQKIILSPNSQMFMRPLYSSLIELHDLLKDDMTAALNIRIGFNAQDGDS